ncbi:MAG: hypothetical protein ACRDTA_24300, partial [Pseudonocardiaceae bacterium]
PPVPPTPSTDLPSNPRPHRATPNPVADDQSDVLNRLTAIDHRIHQVSTQLSTLLSQLDKTCATLETLAMCGSRST